MSPAELDDFLQDCLCDNRLAALELESGQNLSQKKLIHLAAEAKALYLLLSLQGRNLDRVKEHRILWQEAAQFFHDALAIWHSVPTNSELLDALTQLLAHLHALASDRVQFYSVSPSDRRSASKLD